MWLKYFVSIKPAHDKVDRVSLLDDQATAQVMGLHQ